MKTLYLDCTMGAAGDMLMGALLSLHPDPEEMVKQLQAMGVPGVAITAERQPWDEEGTAMRMHIQIHGREEGQHHHRDEHSHHHHHQTVLGVDHVLSQLCIPDKVRDKARAVYEAIAEAESRAHGCPVEEIHFHEVGQLDAIVDVTGCCLLLETLEIKRVVASPIGVGGGTVHCAHGELPVPAPATAYLLEGLEWQYGPVDSELCTPTGAALLRTLVSEFATECPQMTDVRCGCGLGSKMFPGRLNGLYASLGTENKHE